MFQAIVPFLDFLMLTGVKKKEEHTKMLAVKYTFCWKEEVSYSYS